AGARNVIAGNTSEIRLEYATGTTIQGNYIGVDKTGNYGLSNLDKSLGIYVEVGTTTAPIGGTAAGAGNVIGSGQFGIYIAFAGTSGTLVQGNSIGVGADGV